MVGPITDLADGLANFSTIQDLVELLAWRLGLDPAVLGLAFDPGGEVFTFGVPLTASATGSEHVGFDVDLPAGLGTFEFDANVATASSLDLDFTVGVDLGLLARDRGRLDEAQREGPQEGEDRQKAANWHFRS